MKLRIIYLNLCFQDEANVFVWGEYSWGVTNVWDHPYVTPETLQSSSQTIQACQDGCKGTQQSWQNNFETCDLPLKTQPSSFQMTSVCQLICCITNSGNTIAIGNM